MRPHRRAAPPVPSGGRPRRPRLLAVALAALLATAAGCASVARWRGGGGTSPAPDPSLQPQVERFRAAAAARLPARATLDEADLQRFAVALTLTRDRFVDPVDPRALADAAIAGLDAPADGPPRGDGAALVEAGLTAMLASLDPHSAYIGPDLFAELHSDRRGQFGGVGLEITKREGMVTIVTPIEGGPAARAGVVAGDQLLAIGDAPVRGQNLVEVVRQLRGPTGSTVGLTVRRQATDEVATIALVREVVQIRPVTSERIGERIGYVRITQFGERTTGALTDALAALQGEGPLDILVLDLRDNPGGLLTEAVRVADAFLDSGTIVATEGRAEERQVFAAHPVGTWRGRLVVLVNGGSAAGSEILARALQAHGRAAVVGAPTAGNGTIQTVLPLDEQAALRLTTSRAHDPSGAPLDRGVQPDLVFEEARGAAPPSARDAVVTAALRHLAGGGGPP